MLAPLACPLLNGGWGPVLSVEEGGGGAGGTLELSFNYANLNLTKNNPGYGATNLFNFIGDQSLESTREF